MAHAEDIFVLIFEKSLNQEPPFMHRSSLMLFLSMNNLRIEFFYSFSVILNITKKVTNKYV